MSARRSPTTRRRKALRRKRREHSPARAGAHARKTQQANVGLEALQQGRFAKAESELRDALSQYPDDVDTLSNLAVAIAQQGRADEAVGLFSRVCELAPDDAENWGNLAHAFQQAGRIAQAAEAARQAALKERRGVQYHQLWAQLERQAGNLDRSAEAYGLALQRNPRRADLHSDLVAVLRDLGRLDEAMEHCRQAVELEPACVSAWVNGSTVLAQLGRHEEAEDYTRQAIRHDPRCAQAWGNLSHHLLAGGRTEESVDAARQAVSLAPEDPSLLTKLGVALRIAGQPEEALEVLRRAAQLQPNQAEAYLNVGNALKDLRRLAEARETYRKCIRLNPETPEAKFTLGLCYLQAENYREGWQYYEDRWGGPNGASIRPFHHPRWDGQPVDGSVLIWGEQGIGDQIMFAGFFADLHSNGRYVIECEPRLVPVLERSFPHLEVIPLQKPPADRLLQPDIRAQLPMGSLPGLLDFPKDSTQGRVGYLQAHAEQAAALRQRYLGDSTDRLVGISWYSGNLREGPRRSVKLQRWGPMLSVPGIRFVNLQYGPCGKALRSATLAHGVDILDDETINPLEDLDGFAAQVAAMDLVISIDNSTVHMAGALGTPCWVLLPFSADWRWGLDSERTCWYRSLRLWRQESPGNWADLMPRVGQELRAWSTQPEETITEMSP